MAAGFVYFFGGHGGFMKSLSKQFRTRTPRIFLPLALVSFIGMLLITDASHASDQATNWVSHGPTSGVGVTANAAHAALAKAWRTVSIVQTAGDDCASPTVIPNNGPFPWSLTLDKEGGTDQKTDPPTGGCTGWPPIQTFWFEFTPKVSGSYYFFVHSSRNADAVSVWQGPSCGPYTAVPSGCSLEPNAVVVNASAGVTLRIMVSGVQAYDRGTVRLTVTPPSFVQFSAAGFSVNEAGFATIPISRAGDTSSTATVDVTTADGTAKQSRDYTIAATRLTFGPGETTRNFVVLVSDNLYVDGDRTLSLSLSNSTNVVPSTPTEATLTIVDNDTGPATTNPLDNADARFFVRQHYYDFLSRLPDVNGMDFWVSQITECGGNQGCINRKHLDVSNAFFAEAEYQQTAAYVLRLYRAAFGNNQPFPNPDNSNPTEARKIPAYAVFALDRARLIGSASLAQDQLELANAFVQRSEFLSKYPGSLTGPQFVDSLLGNIRSDNGVDLTSLRAALIAEYNQGGPGTVLYRVADDNVQTNPINIRAFIDAEYNRAFVASQYFGFLRRDSDISGFLFWLAQVDGASLRDVQKQHAMVCSFITSTEYQQRFSPVVTHTNAECPQ